MDLTTNMAVATIAIVVTALLGFIVIPALRRLKYGQTILEIGPVWHKDTKQGIPTMGGIMFIIGSLAAFGAGLAILWGKGLINLDEFIGRANFFRSISGMLMALCFAFVGFLDDYIKVRKKRNEGLTANQKIIFQIMIIAAYFTARVMSGDTSTVITFPFLGQLDLWYFYYLTMGLAILYLVNAVNLTDGIDGLCGSVTLIYTTAFMVICSVLQFTELSVLAVAVAGGCLGFLIWNFHPAKVIMGDTGSMFLGGIVCALGIGSGCEVIMLVAAAVYIWEALTVLIQVMYFKLTGGKRLFKMTPIHHSFEISGWKEVRIVLLFSILAAIAGVCAILLTSGL
ncbi:MAG: phospho-N-acetylmuramoyl-pentapeptide-transferase [Oscillospiraceae bacterium]|jgi:phospho-N-acetylmuramoyl-pentapeptide-transferase|nr:phospho-N-acetylmuramoyl-pentapeptide-transferase [Oscillospiraceae bacterium]